MKVDTVDRTYTITEGTEQESTSKLRLPGVSGVVTDARDNAGIIGQAGEEGKGIPKTSAQGPLFSAGMEFPTNK